MPEDYSQQQLDKYKRNLQSLLRKLFQFDAADLDFGIYRIMNQKRDAIERFIDKDLIGAVDEAFDKYSTVNRGEIEREIADIRTRMLSTLGAGAFDEAGEIVPVYRETPLAKEYNAKKEELQSADMSSQHKAEIFSHIHTFFSRYYDAGDFMSLRRYSKDNKYVIPYNGEEVLLHWANKDQYYIKTGEYFNNYSFKVGEWKVNFNIVQAEVEKGNVKSQKNRYFLLKEGNDFIEIPEDGENEVANEIVIKFEYRGMSEDEMKRFKNKQEEQKKKEINEHNEKRILELFPDIPALRAALEKIVNPDEKDKKKQKSYLRRQLNRYTAKNTTDYFIHKNLKKFLDTELDFYIKNEVMHLDDIVSGTESMDTYLTRIRVIRDIASKIIEFLAQIEDFQKKLWEKKKFVLETNYCITLDRVPEELYPEIAANDAQREEWVRLFAIDEIQPTLEHDGYSEPLTVEFLKANDKLVLDTTLFPPEFKHRVLDAFDDIDMHTDGLLVYSDNFHALSFLQEKFRRQIECIHIDPPYNTATSGFLYKNNYQHSSWLAMMFTRAEIAAELLAPDGGFQCHIDENEYEVLYQIFDLIGLPDAGTIVWDKKNPMLGRKGIATQHEYVIWRGWCDGPIYLGSTSVRQILSAAKTIISKHGGVNDESRREFSQWVSNHEGLTGGERAYRLLDDDGRVFQSVGMGAPEYRTNPKFHIPLIHPVTGKECPVPANGWSRTPDTIKKLVDAGDVIFGADETTQPRKKVYLTGESKRQVASIIEETGRGKKDVLALGVEFPYCHPVSLYETLLGASVSQLGLTLDYFAGSGTTAHAVINLNREDNGNRKYILVEMGDYFNTVLKPRIQKVVYSENWKNGKPTSRDTGISHCFKYMRLEQYEDTLNNISFEQRTLDEFDDYLLKYMLDFETRGSACRVDIDKFRKPFEYKLWITDSDGERESQNVDLVETFNYLLGIHVKRLKAFENDGTRYRVVHGYKDGESDTYTVIWRNCDGDLDLKADRTFIEETILAEFKAKTVYINGDFFVEGALPIEPEFKQRMGG